jgi:hypothetical protein
MKTQFRLITGFGIAALALTFQGCALMSFDEDRDQVDPIAKVAAAIRDGRTTNEASMADSGEFQQRVRSAMAYQELIPGMEMQQVRAVLGEPYDIETAGDAGSGNQRWVYPLGLSGRFGLGSERFLYFEHGKLVGWENRTRH